MRAPRLLSHIFDSESKSVSFGWALFITGTVFYAVQAPGFDVQAWQYSTFISTLLVGGKVVKETILDGLAKRAALPK